MVCQHLNIAYRMKQKLKNKKRTKKKILINQCLQTKYFYHFFGLSYWINTFSCWVGSYFIKIDVREYDEMQEQLIPLEFLVKLQVYLFCCLILLKDGCPFNMYT